MNDNYSIPACISEELRRRGYADYTQMNEYIDDWWGWFTGTSSWYEGVKPAGAKHNFDAKRLSIHPARRVCREWASLILDDRTTVAADDARADAWLEEWMDDTAFLEGAQAAVERAFGTGTGAWALWFDKRDEGTSIKVRRYDARMVKPLSWDVDAVTECAFCTCASVHGKRIDQLQMHVLDPDTDTYHIITVLFRDGTKVTDPGIIEDFDTLSELPTFSLIRPAIDNVYADLSPYGQSVFADAIGAIKSVDNAFDSMSREIDATKVKVFMSDSLFDMALDQNGNKVPVPMSPDNVIIRKVAATEKLDMIDTFAPDIRIEPLRTALDTALAELGDLTGFGSQYFRFDQKSGLKTATEVSADNSALFRNIRKHENLLGSAMEHMLASVLDCARTHCAAPVPEGCTVKVDFDDSIITDTASEKSMAMSEIAAGIANPWEYRARFFGEDDDTARANVPAAVGIAGGTPMTTVSDSKLNGAQMQSLMAIMGRFASGAISEGQAVNLISTAIGVDKDAARKLLEGDMGDVVTAPVEPIG